MKIYIYFYFSNLFKTFIFFIFYSVVSTFVEIWVFSFWGLTQAGGIRWAASPYFWLLGDGLGTEGFVCYIMWVGDGGWFWDIVYFTDESTTGDRLIQWF